MGETQLPFKNCSSASANNSPLCSGARLSCIGILVRVWTRWNSLRPSPTWTIWCLNTNNTKRLLPKMRVNLTKKRRKKWPKNLEKNTQNRNQKKKFLQKPGPKFFRTFSLSTRTHHYKKLHSILFGNWYHDSKTQEYLHHHACFFFSFAITRCFAKHFKYYYKYSLKLSIL